MCRSARGNPSPVTSKSPPQPRQRARGQFVRADVRTSYARGRLVRTGVRTPTRARMRRSWGGFEFAIKAISRDRTAPPRLPPGRLPVRLPRFPRPRARPATEGATSGATKANARGRARRPIKIIGEIRIIGNSAPSPRPSGQEREPRQRGQAAHRLAGDRHRGHRTAHRQERRPVAPAQRPRGSETPITRTREGWRLEKQSTEIKAPEFKSGNRAEFPRDTRA